MESGSSVGQQPQSSQSPHGAGQFGSPRNRQGSPGLTPEEMSILKECNSESFWFRCVPLMAVFGATTPYLIRLGYLKPSPKYGTLPKTFGTVLLGFIAGKMSYQNVCQQKILEKIPHSNMAQMIRKQRGQTSVYDQAPMSSVEPEESQKRVEKMRDSYSSMDSNTDTSSQNIKELDDNLRPSLDREVKQVDESALEAQRTLTYDELRQKNRQDYEKSLATSNSPFRQRPFPPPRSSAPHTDESSASPLSRSRGPSTIWDAPPPVSPGRAFEGSGGQRKNAYGDTWDNN